MSRKLSSVQWLAIGLAVCGLAWADTAQASRLFEWDYYTGGNGGADFSTNGVPGTSSVGTLENSPAINTGSTGLGTNLMPELQFGMMKTSLYTNQGVRTTGTTGEYRDYFGTTASGNFGTGTVVMVYNPGFPTLASTVGGEGGKQKPDNAQFLFSASAFGSSGACRCSCRIV